MTAFVPNWPAPATVRALSTTRQDGHSQSPFDEFNLATHVDDEPESVIKNRDLLIAQNQLPSSPLWLTQTHSTTVINADNWLADIEADACYSNTSNQICIVMTADCLPVLVCNRQGTEVAAIHAGWRGLANGIIASTLTQFQSDREELLVWLGPAIGPEAFEVGQDVFECFTKNTPETKAAFKANDNSRYLADIYQLARQQLSSLSIEQVFGGEHCTVTDQDRFFSYRRDGQTGRMASMIWLDMK